jgi:hypothetical protein
MQAVGKSEPVVAPRDSDVAEESPEGKFDHNSGR